MHTRKHSTFERMHYLSFLLWIFVDKFLSGSASTCLIHDKCLDDLRKFSHADEFSVYTTLEEAEAACSEAKDAYLCVKSAPECRDASEMAKLSPVLRGSYRLLNEFCGFKSKRRPCCALRTAYLEHNTCYEEVSERLNDCNDKYRKSLDMILDIEKESEQKNQRFCSLKWLGNCVKLATQSYCGKVAAQIIKSYVTKAGKPEKSFVTENDECSESLYGNDEDRRHFCEEKHFNKCHVHLFFLHEYLVEDRLTDDEKFLSVCTGIHDSLECLNKAFKRCLFSKAKKLQKTQTIDEENEACLVKENVLERYRGKVYCLTLRIQLLSLCQPEFDTVADIINQTMTFSHYNQYFCGVLKKLETCWIKTASSFCGDTGKEVMADIIEMAAINLYQNCNK